jgi:hypothetical protein
LSAKLTLCVSGQNRLNVSLTLIVWPLSPCVVDDGWGLFHFKCSFLHLFILYLVFHTFLKLND